MNTIMFTTHTLNAFSHHEELLYIFFYIKRLFDSSEFPAIRVLFSDIWSPLSKIMQ